jgi:hypothetical protein
MQLVNNTVVKVDTLEVSFHCSMMKKQKFSMIKSALPILTILFDY